MKPSGYVAPGLVLAAALLSGGCGRGQADAAAEAPPPAQVVHEQEEELVRVERAGQFPLATAVAHDSTSQLSVTGTVAPDVSRSVPIVSIASGRVVEIDARLGDTVSKGQLLLRVQSADLSAAFSDYRKAVADEQLARTQYERFKDLYAHGAISLNDLQVAEDAAEKARVDAQNTAERVRVLGGNLDHPTAIVEIRAPVAGVITDQQVTYAAGVAGLGSPNPFTISDLSYVWAVCDVYENDLAGVRTGQSAEIRLNAYPDKVLNGRISNIGAVLDPAMRTAKVRIEVRNPGMMRLGMFVTATIHGQKRDTHVAVPATAILHLHDRDWVYVPHGDNEFRRVEVRAGSALPGNLQEVLSGIQPGTRVIRDSLVFQNTVEQ